jgi:hypothetical protein
MRDYTALYPRWLLSSLSQLTEPCKEKHVSYFKANNGWQNDFVFGMFRYFQYERRKKAVIKQ